MILFDLVCLVVILPMLLKTWRELRGAGALARGVQEGRRRFDQQVGQLLRNWLEAFALEPQQRATYRSLARAAEQRRDDPYPVFGLLWELIHQSRRFELSDGYVENCVRNRAARIAPQLPALANLRDKLAKVGLTFSAAAIFFALGVYLVTHDPDAMLELVRHGAACSAAAMFGTIIAAEGLKRAAAARELAWSHGAELAWPLQLVLNHLRRAGRPAVPLKENQVPTGMPDAGDATVRRLSTAPAAAAVPIGENGGSPVITSPPPDTPPACLSPAAEPHLNPLVLAALESDAAEVEASTPC